MAKVIVGSHYETSKKVDLTLEQDSFFFYLLELVMEDKNLSHVDGWIQAHNKKLLEDKIVDVIPMLKKFQIVDHPHVEEDAWNKYSSKKSWCLKQVWGYDARSCRRCKRE